MKGYIDGKPVEFGENETILQVAERYGIFIPTLCALEEIDHYPGTCRVCLVEIQRKGDERKYLVTSCNTPMEEGMKVFTRSRPVREARRLQVELLLADHNQDCATCIRHGDCELQDVAQFVGLQKSRFTAGEFFEKRYYDDSSPAIVMDMSKCIRCFRCVKVCREVQGTDVLVITGEGTDVCVAPRDAKSLEESDCVSCGQCTLVCPVGALAERDDTELVIDFLYDENVITVFQFAPAIRVSLAEEFGGESGEILTGHVVAALKKLGADYVFDTNFGADVVVVEEAHELLERIEKGGTLPLFTSCSPAWINFLEKYYPEFIPHASTVKSPQQVLGTLIKTYFAEKNGIPPSKIRVVSIMPCTAKKDECSRDEFALGGLREVDVVLTTREFVRLLKREGIDLLSLEPQDYDVPILAEHTGAGAIFGATGGVMEAALRTLYYLVNGENLKDVEIKEVRGRERRRECEIDLGKELGKVKLAVVNGLKAARELLEDIKSGEANYVFVEFMACPGGCVGGGGQPKSKKGYYSAWEKRREAIYEVDRSLEIRCSHENPFVKRIYEEFLGSPLSETSHRYLHRGYVNRKREIKHTIKEIWDEIRKKR